jgi:hypothetical protein
LSKIILTPLYVVFFTINKTWKRIFINIS